MNHSSSSGTKKWKKKKLKFFLTKKINAMKETSF